MDSTAENTENKPSENTENTPVTSENTPVTSENAPVMSEVVSGTINETVSAHENKDAPTTEYNAYDTPVSPRLAVVKPATELQITKKHVQNVIDNIDMILNGHKLTPINIVRVAANLMSVASSMKDLPKRLRKNVIISGIENYLDQQTMDPTDKEAILLMLDGVVSEAVDVYSDIKDGTISIRNGKGCCTVL